MEHGNPEDNELEKKQSGTTRVLNRFANKTSMSGVIYISEAKKIYAKLIWSILLTGAVGVMIYHLYFLITDFLEFKTTTTIVIGFNNLQLPAVTICNANPFLLSEMNKTETKLQNLITSTKPSKFLKDSRAWTKQRFRKPTYTETTLSKEEIIDNHVFVLSSFGIRMEDDDRELPKIYWIPKLHKIRRKRFVDELNNLNLSAFDDTAGDSHDSSKGTKDPITDLQETFQKLYMEETKSTRLEIGHQIDKMMLRCSFHGYECNQNLTVYQTQEYGNCFTLQSKEMVVEEAGPSGGLTLVLYIQTQEYLPGITEGYGVRVTVHPYNTIPFPHASGFFVDAGQETSVSLQQVTISRKPDPYGNCTTTNDFQDTYDKEYTRESCQYTCLGSTIIESCGCFDTKNEQIFLSTKPTSKPCRTAEERQCKRDITSKYRKQEITCNCPEPCEEETYTKTITSRTWPTETYAALLREAVCQNFKDDCNQVKAMNSMQLSRNFLKLNVYYQDLNFQTIEEEADTENSQFLSDLGGAVGLWIGLSVLSIFEIVHLLVEVCRLCCKRKSPGKGINRPNPRTVPGRVGLSDAEMKSLNNSNFSTSEFGMKRREPENFSNYKVYRGPDK